MIGIQGFFAYGALAAVMLLVQYLIGPNELAQKAGIPKPRAVLGHEISHLKQVARDTSGTIDESELLAAYRAR